MFRQLLPRPNQLIKRASSFVLAAVALSVTATTANAATCLPVFGRYVEHATTENCSSPVGFCIAGEYSGVISGDFFGSATAFIPTADTPTTSALAFTSDSTIHARMGGKEGDLIIKNAGLFRTIDNGEIVDLQTIVGGTDDFAGASGVLRASGVFNPESGMGESEYIGNICLP